MKSIDDVWGEMEKRGMAVPNDEIRIRVDEADVVLYKLALNFFEKTGRKFDIGPVKEQYRAVADWLSDNEGKGLLLFGEHGLGKTVLAKYLIPAVLLSQCDLVCRYYLATQLKGNIDEVMKKAIVSIDDIGVESQAVEYGNRRNMIDELLDNAEQNGNIVILTTNLDADGLIEKYGYGVFDRICAVTRQIKFEGESFRGK